MRAKRYQINAVDLIEAVKQATRGTEAQMPDDATVVSVDWIGGSTRAMIVTVESMTAPEATVGVNMLGEIHAKVDQVRITHDGSEWKEVRHGMTYRG